MERQGRTMQRRRSTEAGKKGPRDHTRGSAHAARRAKGAPSTEPPKPRWSLTQESLAAMSPAQRHRHLLFGDLLHDVGLAPSIFPRESVEVTHRMPDPRAWTQPLEPPGEPQDRLVGVLKAAEARGRVRALRLRYNRLRAEEILLLIQHQRSARAAMRLEVFLPPQLKPTRIPDPLDRQEVPVSPGKGEGGPTRMHTRPQPLSPQRRRVETIMEDKAEGGNFLR